MKKNKTKINFIFKNKKLLGFGWSSLVGIDPNADNFCGAGIVFTSTQQYGCLYRLEPNNNAQVILKSKIYSMTSKFSHYKTNIILRFG